MNCVCFRHSAVRITHRPTALRCSAKKDMPSFGNIGSWHRAGPGGLPLHQPQYDPVSPHVFLSIVLWFICFCISVYVVGKPPTHLVPNEPPKLISGSSGNLAFPAERKSGHVLLRPGCRPHMNCIFLCHLTIDDLTFRHWVGNLGELREPWFWNVIDLFSQWDSGLVLASLKTEIPPSHSPCQFPKGFCLYLSNIM